MPRNQAALYLAFLITGIVFAVAPSTLAQKPAPGKHNGKIVFISDRYYKGLSVWTMNPDGSSPTRLTDDTSRTKKLPDFSPVYDGSPTWSADGTKIAFISARDYHFLLYVMNADGSNARLVTDKLMEMGSPAWSPDGEKLAFTVGGGLTVGFDRPVSNIYVINTDGSGLTQLTRDSGMNGSPDWSPDGKQIVFSSTRDSFPESKIWVMNADGSNQRVLPNPQNTKGTGFGGGAPAWSPDGAKILYAATRICGRRAGVGIYVVNADGSNNRLLTNDQEDCGRYDSPRWSPDGTKILAGFTPEQKGLFQPAPQIVVMNADGSNQINISNRGKYVFNSGLATYSDVHADWQPVSAPLDFKSSVVGFSESSYTAFADVDSVPITVTRTGNLDDVASCFYVTLIDNPELLYYDAKGTLRFSRGESSKTISIPNPLKGFQLTTSLKIILSDNEGNATFVGGNKEAALKISPR
jgi:TolB protein